jgi:hypothetical protein
VIVVAVIVVAMVVVAMVVVAMVVVAMRPHGVTAGLVALCGSDSVSEFA